MRLWDPKYRGHRLQYLLQVILAAMVMFIILILLDAITHAALVAALGASTFIAFAMPHREASKTRYLVGGYAVGIVSGGAVAVFRTLPWIAAVIASPPLSTALWGAIAVGCALFGMVVTDTEHPPAAGVALGLAIGELDPRAFAVISLGIVFLATARRLMKPYLMDLI